MMLFTIHSEISLGVMQINKRKRFNERHWNWKRYQKMEKVPVLKDWSINVVKMAVLSKLQF